MSNPLTPERREAITRLGEVFGKPSPRCRDCADSNGTCPRDGTPCDPKVAAQQAFEALPLYEAALSAAEGEIERLKADKDAPRRLETYDEHEARRREAEAALTGAQREIHRLRDAHWKRLTDATEALAAERQKVQELRAWHQDEAEVHKSLASCRKDNDRLLGTFMGQASAHYEALIQMDLLGLTPPQPEAER